MSLTGLQPLPAGEQRPTRERRLRYRPELGYRLTGSGDSHRLPPGNPIHHITSVVAQFPNGYFRHEASVSRVVHSRAPGE